MAYHRKSGTDGLRGNWRERREKVRVFRDCGALNLIEEVPLEGGVDSDVEVEGLLGATEKGSGDEEVR